MTYRVTHTPERFVEVEYFGATTFADRAAALDALGVLDDLPAPKKILVNFLGANVVGDDNEGRLDFIAKAITHPVLKDCKVANTGRPTPV